MEDRIKQLEQRVAELEILSRRHAFVRGEHGKFCVCGLPIDAACHLLVLDDLCAPHTFIEDHPAFGGLCSGCGRREGHDVHAPSHCRVCGGDDPSCKYCAPIRRKRDVDGYCLACGANSIEG